MGAVNQRKREKRFSIKFGALVLAFLISVAIASIILASFVLVSFLFKKLPTLSAILSVTGFVSWIFVWALMFKKSYKYFESRC